MLIINREVFAEARKKFPAKSRAIDDLLVLLETARPRNTADLRAVVAGLKSIIGHPKWFRIDVGGRRGLRMIAVIEIQDQSIDVRYLGDHAGYEAMLDKLRKRK